MPDQLYFIVSFLCALQGILLAFIFLAKKGRHPATQTLGAYLFIFSVGMLENFLREKITGTPGQLVYSFLGFSNFLYGPLLYLFVCFLTEKAPGFKVRQLLHLLPFAILYLADTVSILGFNQPIRSDNRNVEFLAFELLVVQLLGYNLLAIRKLTKHAGSILQIHSSLEEKDLKWLRSVVVFLTGIYILSFGITHFVAFGFTGAAQFYVLVQLLITAVIYAMSYRLLLQSQVFSFHIPAENNEEELIRESYPVTPAGKYQRSGLRPELAEQNLQKLLAFMETEKPYLDPELTIYLLSEKVGVSRNHLTEIINEKLGKNFFEFINTYRVEEVKTLLTDSRFAHLNLYALGLEAGFKSKTAFNTNFKKITGLTPTEWKQQVNPPETNTPNSVIVLNEVLT